jgi:hypothetical protein
MPNPTKASIPGILQINTPNPSHEFNYPACPFTFRLHPFNIPYHPCVSCVNIFAATMARKTPRVVSDDNSEDEVVVAPREESEEEQEEVEKEVEDEEQV